MRLGGLALAAVMVAACTGSSSPREAGSVPAASTALTTASGTGSMPTTPTTSVPATTAVSTTTTTTTPTSPPGTIPAAPTTVQPEAGPEYIVTGQSGVFRVVDNVATVVLDRPDVIRAGDDGMGGLVYYPEPGVIEHLPAGASSPTVLAVGPSYDYVTVVGGSPTLAIVDMPQEGCEDADSGHSVLIDLTTGERRLHIPCIPVESRGIAARSIGGDLSVSVPGGGWPYEEPIWSRLAFRHIDLSSWVGTLTAWDDEATERWAALELDLPANPWPEPCRWCTLSPRLSRDGATLALAEFVPSATDLGTADWEEFDTLELQEQWRRWEELRMVAEVRLRTIDLDTGTTLYTAPWAGPGWVLDFDGRYLLYEAGGTDPRNLFPDNLHLIDTRTGLELPIEWGTADPGRQGSVSLALSG